MSLRSVVTTMVSFYGACGGCVFAAFGLIMCFVEDGMSCGKKWGLTNTAHLRKMVASKYSFVRISRALTARDGCYLGVHQPTSCTTI